MRMPHASASVKARLDGQNIAFAQRERVGGLAQTVRMFMHQQPVADAMPGAVIVIQPHLPQGRAGQRVQLTREGADRKPRRRQRDKAAQHSGGDAADIVRDRDKGHGPGHIGRANQILPAGIAQENLLHRQPRGGLARRVVPYAPPAASRALLQHKTARHADSRLTAIQHGDHAGLQKLLFILHAARRRGSQWCD